MTKFGIGQAVRRVEDQRFATGAGQYVGDLSLPRQCYGVAVLSPHAHAAIKRIDVTAAKAAPGVLAVLTGADAVADKIGGIPPFFMPESWAGRAVSRPHGRFYLPTASAALATALLLSSPKLSTRRATPPSLSQSITSRCPRSLTSNGRRSRRRRKSGRIARAAMSA